MASEMAAALREASQACQEMDYPEAPTLGEYIDVDKRRSSTGHSGPFSRRCSFSLSSPTFEEGGNEYLAVEAPITIIQDAGIELNGEDEGAINASGRAAQTRRWSCGLRPRRRLSASDLGVMDQNDENATEVEPLYDSMSFPEPCYLAPMAQRRLGSQASGDDSMSFPEPRYLAPIARRRLKGNKASGDGGVWRQTRWHVDEDFGCPPTSPPRPPLPPRQPPSVPPCVLRPVADDALYGDALYGMSRPPSPAEEHATSCAEQMYGYGKRLSYIMPPDHAYSICDSGIYDTPIQGIYEHICTVSHH